MVSDGRNTRSGFLSRDKMYIDGRMSRSDRKAGHAAAAAKDIANAMFVDIEPYINNLRYKLVPKQNDCWDRISYYVVTIVRRRSSRCDGQVVEEIWVDRTNWNCSYVVTAKRAGVTDTTFSGYQVSGDAPFPRVVTITVHRGREPEDPRFPGPYLTRIPASRPTLSKLDPQRRGPGASAGAKPPSRRN